MAVSNSRNTIIWGKCGVCTLALTVAKTSSDYDRFAISVTGRSLLVFDISEQDGNTSGPKPPRGTRRIGEMSQWCLIWHVWHSIGASRRVFGEPCNSTRFFQLDSKTSTIRPDYVTCFLRSVSAHPVKKIDQVRDSNSRSSVLQTSEIPDYHLCQWAEGTSVVG